MPRIATLKSTREGENDEDDRDGQEFYAGGANTGPQGGGSGLSVLGPPGGGDSSDPFAQMVARAAQGGPPPEGAGATASEGEAGMVTITLFSDGFTVDDGPLRPLSDPENRGFIESVNSGFCPPELVKDGKPSNVRLKDNRKEKYSAPPTPPGPAYTAFAGDGRTMAAASAGPRITASHGGKVTVDEGEATLRVQVRFPNGKRLVHKFNKTHTLSDLFSVVEASEHFAGLESYELMNQSLSPPEPLLASSESSLLTELGLGGGVVTVRE